MELLKPKALKTQFVTLYTVARMPPWRDLCKSDFKSPASFDIIYVVLEKR